MYIITHRKENEIFNLKFLIFNFGKQKSAKKADFCFL